MPNLSSSRSINILKKEMEYEFNRADAIKINLSLVKYRLTRSVCRLFDKRKNLKGI